MTVELEELDTLDASYDGLPVMLSCDTDGVASLDGLPNIGEAYEMRITGAGIAIRAQKPHGLFNGVMSLMQLLPPYVQMSGDIRLDCMEVSHQCRHWVQRRSQSPASAVGVAYSNRLRESP